MRTQVLLLLLACCAQSTVSRAQVLAFPEAEGFGRFASGARTNLASSTIYHVTNLNNSGAGSLRDALSQSNRFVVFDVGGIINLSSVVTVASNITIAGQTAPGGIQVYGNRVAFHGANNLISRHWAVRGSSSMGREDAASLVRGTNMIWDHMSITWGVDGTFDINPDSGQIIDNLTIQNSIIGQGLDSVGHSTGGLLQPGDGRQTSIIKNLWIDNNTRNPKVKGENEFINNVVYGWGTAAYIMGGDSSGISHVNAEGNYFVEGPIDGSSPFSGGNGNFHIYGNDNWVDGNRNGVLDGTPVTSYPGSDVVASRFAFPTTASLTAQQAVPYITANAGPSIVRDVVDTRMMTEIGSYGLVGGVILRETDLFPNYGTNPSYLNPRARLVDADSDGMADNWETAHGLNPANGADWKGLNGAGFTRLEEYINELGANGTTINSTGGVWNAPGTWATTPTLADAGAVTGNLSVASGQAFARRLNVNGSFNVTGGTLDVFDTVSITNAGTIDGGVVTAGRVILGSLGGNASLALNAGGTLQSGTVALTAGTATFHLDGGTFRATGAPNITVPTTLGAAGGTFDTGAYSGQMTGGISGAGGFTKQGAGALTITGTKSYTGPTVVQGGQVIVQGGNVNQTSGVSLGSGTTLNVAAVGGLNLGAGKSLTGTGTVVGNVVASAGALVNPQGGQVQALAQVVAIQAENMDLGTDWAVFDNTLHGTGVGGSYNGADLNGGGIVMLSNAGGTTPVATGVASATIEVPATKTYYLFARTAEPTLSPIPGDPATQPGGNNSFFVSAQANSVEATTSNFDAVQTLASPGNQAVWNLISTSISPQAGIATPTDAGIAYALTSGAKQFAVYGRESGTIIDGFVLSDTNLSVAQLNQALTNGNLNEERVLTVTGSYQQSVGATFQVEIAGGTTLNKLNVTGSAQLAGDLSVSLANSFTPQASDVFSILSAGTLLGQFDNALAGARIATANGSGSFEVSYDYANNRVMLSNFMAGIAGDFDGDGDVDGQDFLTWQRNPSVGNLSDWQTNYGMGATAGLSSSALPEPGTLLLTSLWLLTCLVRR